MTADQSDCRDQRLDGDFGLRDENVDLLRAKAAEQKKTNLAKMTRRKCRSLRDTRFLS